MTAIGLGVCLLAFIIAWVDDAIKTLPDLVLQVNGIAFVLGFVSFISGLFVWIWRVMP